VTELAGKDRLIVALDVPTHAEAMALVKKLDNVSFFKVGLRLFMAGNIIGFIEKLGKERQRSVFVDIKIGGDIGNTITRFVRDCMETKIVKFLTLVEARLTAITIETVKAARAARGAQPDPRLLMVPYLSSLDASDLQLVEGYTDLNAYIVARAKEMLEAGCDGLIVSGDAIKLCRNQFGPKIDIVSPGIRPAGSSHDDHKRYTTPSQAIALGSDYLVVGRPIINAPKPRDAAQRIIDEIDEQLSENRRSSSGSGGQTRYSLAAKGF